LRGEHNFKNAAIAITAVTLLGRIDDNAAIAAAHSFAGLEHRLEEFEHGGVKWVNDSISTIPAAAIAAVAAFPETDTLIIGGMDRGIDYSTLVAFLLERGDIDVIALPDSGHTIVDMLMATRRAAECHLYKVADMAAAVELARKLTQRCCVLSPAAASYGFYKNFEERGKHFKKLVQGS
jgi:UDP-N-acetylmuramoylalanine--D-glutamate ligase